MNQAKSGSETEERRQHPRKKTFSLVSLVQKEGKIDKSAVMMGRTLDVGKGGIRFESIEPIQPDTDLDMEIAFGDQVFSVMGTVVYCREVKGGMYLVGIKFTDGDSHLPRIPD